MPHTAVVGWIPRAHFDSALLQICNYFWRIPLTPREQLSINTGLELRLGSHTKPSRWGLRSIHVRVSGFVTRTRAHTYVRTYFGFAPWPGPSSAVVILLWRLASLSTLLLPARPYCRSQRVPGHLSENCSAHEVLEVCKDNKVSSHAPLSGIPEPAHVSLNGGHRTCVHYRTCAQVLGYILRESAWTTDRGTPKFGCTRTGPDEKESSDATACGVNSSRSSRRRHEERSRFTLMIATCRSFDCLIASYSPDMAAISSLAAPCTSSVSSGYRVDRPNLVKILQGRPSADFGATNLQEASLSASMTILPSPNVDPVRLVQAYGYNHVL